MNTLHKDAGGGESGDESLHGRPEAGRQQQTGPRPEPRGAPATVKELLQTVCKQLMMKEEEKLPNRVIAAIVQEAIHSMNATAPANPIEAQLNRIEKAVLGLRMNPYRNTNATTGRART